MLKGTKHFKGIITPKHTGFHAFVQFIFFSQSGYSSTFDVYQQSIQVSGLQTIHCFLIKDCSVCVGENLVSLKVMWACQRVVDRLGDSVEE